MTKPRILDLFSGAGGAARGYQMAGFEVVGVDIVEQPRYIGEHFAQLDAIAVLAGLLEGSGFWDRDGCLWHLEDFDAFHASPPCQAYSRVGNHARASGKIYPDLIPDTWWRLTGLSLPWVIENVVGAPLDVTLLLCGSMFDPPMSIRRHRIFESNVVLAPPMWACRHKLMAPRFELYEHYKKRLSSTVRVNGGYTKGAAEAMEIDWMTRAELVEAIPPRYTEFIGKALLEALSRAL